MGSAQQDVGFRIGRKNRFLAVRHSQRLGIGYRGDANDYVTVNYSQPGAVATEFMRVSVDPSVKTATLHATATVPAQKDADLPFREGVTSTIESQDVEIGPFRRVVTKRGEPVRPRPYGSPPTGTDYWTVVLGVKGAEGGYFQWGYTPLDASGTPIRFVDAQGRPVSAIKALALEPSLQPGNASYYPNGDAPPVRRPKAMPTYFQGVGQSPAFRIATNVDPRWIATLRIRASHQETSDLGPFPLDPQPSGP